MRSFVLAGIICVLAGSWAEGQINSFTVSAGIPTSRSRTMPARFTAGTAAILMGNSCGDCPRNRGSPCWSAEASRLDVL